MKIPSHAPDSLLPLDLQAVSPEWRFLLSVVRFYLGTTSVQELKAAAAVPLDWEFLGEAMVWHRFQGLCFKVLKEELVEEVPPDALLRLEQVYRTNAGYNLRQATLLFSLLGAFNSANIPVLVIKGLALAGPLYGDVALRRSGDIDLLVDQDDVPAAMHLLCSMEGCTTPPIDPAALDLLLKTDNEMKIYLNGFLIELQWRLGPLARIYDASSYDLFREAENISMAGRGIPTLGNLEMVPYLCFHGTKHQWYRLFWLLDVAVWLKQRPQSNWERILLRARARGQERALLLGLALVHHLLGLSLPDDFHQPIADMPQISQRITTLRCHLLDHTDRPYAPEIGGLSFLANTWWMYATWRNRLQLGWRYVFQPTLKDWQAAPWARSGGLLYLVRPVRLMRLVLGKRKGGVHGDATKRG